MNRRTARHRWRLKEERFKQKALDMLGRDSVGVRVIFRDGNVWKLSVTMKGFDLTPEQQAQIAALNVTELK